MQSTSTNFIARLARWSSEHRKIAILGWLAFVVGVFGLMSNGVIETERLTTAESVAGEAGDAEEMLTDAGLRPTSEVAFIQSKDLNVEDPEFQAVINDVAAKLSSTDKVENVASPVDGTGGGYSEDGHSAFVEFEIAGDPSRRRRKRRGEHRDGRAPPGVSTPSTTSSSSVAPVAEKAIEDTIQADVGKAGMLSLPITLLDPPGRSRRTGRRQRAARPRPHLGAGDDGDRRDSQPDLSSGRQRRRADPADRARRRGRLLALLHAPRARRAGCRHDPRRTRCRSPRPTSGRAVMISGLTVIIAMAGMFITGDATFISFAVATVTVVAVAMFATLLVLRRPCSPGSATGSRRAGSRSSGAVAGRSEASRASGGRSSTRVMRQPSSRSLVAGGLLVALAIPALSMNVVQSGTDDLPQDLPMIQTYDRYTEAFPAEANAVEVVSRGRRRPQRRVGRGDRRPGRPRPSASDIVGRRDRSHRQRRQDGRHSGDPDRRATAPTRSRWRPSTRSATSSSRPRSAQVDGTTVHVTGGAAQSSDFGDLL